MVMYALKLKVESTDTAVHVQGSVSACAKYRSMQRAAHSVGRLGCQRSKPLQSQNKSTLVVSKRNASFLALVLRMPSLQRRDVYQKGV